MRNTEIHAREVIYWLSGAFSAVSAKYFIGRVILSETFYTGKENVSNVVFFIILFISCLSTPFIDEYVRKFSYYSNYSQIRKVENIIVISYNLFFAFLLVYAVLYKA